MLLLSNDVIFSVLTSIRVSQPNPTHHVGAEKPYCGAYLVKSDESQVKKKDSALLKEGHLSALARQLTS
jgi:hypothetical protein